jgi:hypothetical protein
MAASVPVAGSTAGTCSKFLLDAFGMVGNLVRLGSGNCNLQVSTMRWQGMCVLLL